jgi:methylmalonyl-CoA mutase
MTDHDPVVPLGLRDDFPAPSLDAWQAECVKLLKGVPFEKKMFTRTYEGLTLRPMYTQADVADLPHAGSLPGQAPFVRGTHALGYRQTPWQVAQELPYPTGEEFNAALVHDLARGQDAVVLVIDEAGQAGLDPDQAGAGKVGRGGTSVASLADLRVALDKVDLGSHPLHIESGSAALVYAALLVALAREKGVDPAKLRGSVGLDPLRGLVELGRLPLALGKAYDELAVLTKWGAANAPGLQTIAASGHAFHDGGANAVQELAFTLAAAVHHLRELEKRGVDVEVAAPRIRLSLSVGTHFFLEIARLRAARWLWSRIVAASGGSEAAQKLTLHARTSRFGLTVLDPHVNILRGTTEAMAAIMGGVDSLCVSPFDQAIGLPDTFSRRIARNTHAILREESHLDLVADPAGGTWYVEALTAEIAEAAWELFQEIEAFGGLVGALQEGWVQAQVASVATERRANLAARRDILVGTNMYANPREQVCAGRDEDAVAVHANRSRAVQAARTSGTQAHDLEVLQKLDNILTNPAPDTFAAVVEAAAKGATVGELCRTFRHDADPHLQVEPIAPCRAAEMFEQVRLAVMAHAATDEAATTVFCANLGDVARYMPRLDFTRGFFQTGGFKVVADRFFATPDDAAAAASASGARTAVITGLDATYAVQGVATAAALKAAGIETVILAGLPTDLVPALKAAGVDEFIHVRTDAWAVLAKLARSKGVSL